MGEHVDYCMVVLGQQYIAPAHVEKKGMHSKTYRFQFFVSNVLRSVVLVPKSARLRAPVQNRTSGVLAGVGVQ